MGRQLQGGPSFAWEPELGGYIGLIQREQGVASLRWFRTETCFVLHVLNAWDDGGRIIVDVMQYDEPPLFPHQDGTMRLPTPEARLVRWTIDPDAGTEVVTWQALDDTAGEFPRIDDRRSGLRHRFGTIAGRSRPGAGLDSLVWLDLAQGSRSLFTLPEGEGFSEPVFVPRGEEAGEGDGWLLATVWRAAENCSVVAVFERRAMKMLIAVIAAQWLHVGHPKMVGERADPAHRLFEGVLDLEARTIETNDLDGLQGRVGAHQEAGASCGMDHGDEAHQAAFGTP
jgi:carotenoid cleavage dioxygenase-like enzyme